MMSHARPLVLIASIIAIAFAPGAFATSKFDGTWTVLVTTKEGPCNETYRFSGQIVDGVMQYSGSSAHNFSGRVGPSGAVSVRLSIGPSSAVATGRLTANSGTGTWHGQGPDGSCSGTWDAERI